MAYKYRPLSQLVKARQQELGHAAPSPDTVEPAAERKYTMFELLRSLKSQDRPPVKDKTLTGLSNAQIIKAIRGFKRP